MDFIVVGWVCHTKEGVPGIGPVGIVVAAGHAAKKVAKGASVVSRRIEQQDLPARRGGMVV